MENVKIAPIHPGAYLKELLEEDARVTRHLTPDQIEALMDPSAYTGLCGVFVDRVAGD